jgi:hypothetical protein
LRTVVTVAGLSCAYLGDYRFSTPPVDAARDAIASLRAALAASGVKIDLFEQERESQLAAPPR